MKIKFVLGIITGVLLQVDLAQAQGLRLGNPVYAGTGCPGGSASVTLSPSEDAISILFDSFVAEAGGTTGRILDRKSCNIAIPVEVPQGYSVAVFQVDYRGFNFVRPGAMTRINTEYFWAGSRGPLFTRTFNGPNSQDFTLTDSLMAQSVVWTPCGTSVNLRVNSSILARANSAYEQTMIGVDSADISSGLIYHIQWRRCF